MSFLRELFDFIRARRKFWLIPIFAVMLVLGGLLVLTKGSASRRSSTRSSEQTSVRVLGISAFYHDSAARIVVDGKIVAAAQEERFTRKKHDAGFPGCRRSLLPDGRQIVGGRARSCGVLREAVSQIRTPARDLSRLCAAGLSIVPKGDAGLAEGEAVPESRIARPSPQDRRQRRLGEEAALRRPPPESRGFSVLSFAVRGGGGPDAWTASANGRRHRPATAEATRSI